MALIACPECHGNVSERALSCIHCGFPIAAHLNSGRMARALGRFVARVRRLLFGSSKYARDVNAFRPSKDAALVIAGERRVKTPTPAQIRLELEALPGDDGGDSFAIYEQSENSLTYMQTRGGSDAGFELEYQAGSLDAHFICTNRALSVDEVVQAFQWYSAGDERWLTQFSWEPLKELVEHSSSIVMEPPCENALAPTCGGRTYAPPLNRKDR